MIVGVDIGGTKVLAGEVASGGVVGRTAQRRTPGRRVEAAKVDRAIVEAVREVAGGESLTAVGIAAAGFVDAEGERVMFAPHLPWRDDPVRQRMQEALGCPVWVDNDANCAGLAEWTLGAGRDSSSMLMITLGTGIGGAIVWGGHVVRGANGMAGEFGHMQVVPDGHPCECGRRGCWEQYSSGNALERYARGRIGAEPTVLEEACDGDPAQLTGPMVTAAADEGDLVARRAFDRVGDWLGVGTANLVAALDPEMVVVGGGVSAAGDRLLEPARVALGRTLVGAGHRDVPGLVSAQLGPQAGMIGAALGARGRLS